MQTEDHPLDYASFEGVIPEGHYGAGPVSVWDQGTFEPEGQLPAAQQLERGELKFVLHGEKLRGSWVLTRTSSEDRKPAWLLIKRNDDEARADEEDITLTRPESVKKAPQAKKTSSSFCFMRSNRSCQSVVNDRHHKN